MERALYNNLEVVVLNETTNTLDIHSGKGNSAIEQKSDQFIMFHGNNPKGKQRVVRSLKARDESTFEILLNFDWNTFRFDKRG
mgnify:CR=1 FL=1